MLKQAGDAARRVLVGSVLQVWKCCLLHTLKVCGGARCLRHVACVAHITFRAGRQVLLHRCRSSSRLQVRTARYTCSLLVWVTPSISTYMCTAVEPPSPWCFWASPFRAHCMLPCVIDTTLYVHVAHPCSVSSALRADEVIGIDLGTTNSCVAVMEGKVRAHAPAYRNGVGMRPSSLWD